MRQLLAFSRNQDVEPTIIDADVVLAHVESMLRPLMHEDVELVRSSERDALRPRSPIRPRSS